MMDRYLVPDCPAVVSNRVFNAICARVLGWETQLLCRGVSLTAIANNSTALAA